ncbi:MAG: redoxin domain-containing protein, partial [Gemmatimonadales bacterium]
MSGNDVLARRLARPALVLALTAAAIIVVALARQKQSLEARYRELAARVDHPYVGMYVPVIRAPCVQSDSVLIGAPGEAERQLLLVFDTRCPYSRASLPWWNALAERLAGDLRVSIYGVSLDSLEASRAYATEHALGFPVVSLTERRAQGLFRLQRVPQILILNDEGRVV